MTEFRNPFYSAVLYMCSASHARTFRNNRYEVYSMRSNRYPMFVSNSKAKLRIWLKMSGLEIDFSGFMMDNDIRMWKNSKGEYTAYATLYLRGIEDVRME